jgi:formylglycine-generating enzyme required for sulfatase activity
LDASEWYQDGDSDGFGNPGFSQPACDQPSGYIDNSNDCNDQNAEISPDGSELCDSVDNNCNGQTDEDSALDALEWFQDTDGDGYGSPLYSTLSCNQPVGYIGDNSDCDDGDSLQNPSATEYCNYDDDDCDGFIDEEDAIDQSIYYIDSDGDGFGDINFLIHSEGTVLECHSIGAPTGYSASADDCDDTQFTVNPLSFWYVDSDMDGFGNNSIFFQSCLAPYGFISDNQDCDDTNASINPDATEICDGYNNDCDGGSTAVPADESDDDGDGFIECLFDVELYLWGDPAGAPLGEGDCDDSDINAYPRAIEICNGAFEDCNDPDIALQDAPDLETDDDGDGFVECTLDVDPLLWENPNQSITGGDDCRDLSADTYPGAAYLTSTTTCLTDADGDGYSDCERTICDYGIALNTTTGIDFVEIPAGDDPLGNYTITYDFYMSTTEITDGQFEEFMGYGHCAITEDQPMMVYNYEAMQFANALSSFTGLPECYGCTGSGSNTICIINSSYDPDLHLCPGYRLSTEGEWEYAARSGTTNDIWTVNGGGDINQITGCAAGILSDGSLLEDYAWHSCNQQGNEYCGGGGSGMAFYQGPSFPEVAQKIPNAFNLYDMHGNQPEFTNDCSDNFYDGVSFPVSTENPFHYDPNCNTNILRGGSIFTSVEYVPNYPYSYGGWQAWIYTINDNYGLSRAGIRLVRTKP